MNRFRDIDVGNWPKKNYPKNATFFAHPLCASLSPCLQYSISFGSKKADNVDWAYILLLSNLIEEGTVQCIVESVDRSKGLEKQKKSFQKLKVAFEWERYVLESCPSQGLISSWGHQTLRRTTS